MKQILTAFFSLTVLAACATDNTSAPRDRIAPTPMASEAERTSQIQHKPGIPHFEPNPTTNTKFDYAIWDEALSTMVFYMGSSLRQRASDPNPETGSRFVIGHDSPYRLEGNKVVFEFFDDDFEAAISDYRQSLVELANEYSIPSLPRNEQLIFWFNLHNVLVIDELAKAYPVQHPDRYKIGGVPFNEAPLVTIDGHDLSLKNIREDIVYSYWDDPVVMYGFFHGTLGGPTIQREGFNSRNLATMLRRNAREYINSLRGVHGSGKTMWVSGFFEEGAPYYFPNFDEDLRAHIANYAREDVLEILNRADKVRIYGYEDRIADLSGGEIRTANLNVINGQQLSGQADLASDPRITPQIARMLGEYSQKVEKMRSRGGFRGTVTIIDIPTVDPDAETIE